jgi:hypothetical protein
MPHLPVDLGDRGQSGLERAGLRAIPRTPHKGAASPIAHGDPPPPHVPGRHRSDLVDGAPHDDRSIGRSAVVEKKSPGSPSPPEAANGSPISCSPGFPFSRVRLVQRLTHHGVHEVPADPRVDRRRAGVPVPDLFLDEPGVHPVFDLMGYMTVPKAMRRELSRQVERCTILREPRLDLPWPRELCAALLWREGADNRSPTAVALSAPTTSGQDHPWPLLRVLRIPNCLSRLAHLCSLVAFGVLVSPWWPGVRDGLGASCFGSSLLCWFCREARTEAQRKATGNDLPIVFVLSTPSTFSQHRPHSLLRVARFRGRSR